MEPGYYDPDGNPITLMDWAERVSEMSRRIVAEDQVWLRGEVPATLRTVYHGFVDPAVCADMFGTAILTGPDEDRQIVEVQMYSTMKQARDGHALHLLAIHRGHHCHRCYRGRAHHEHAAQQEGPR